MPSQGIFWVKKMNIAIIGYGKMGKEIEKAASIKDMNVVSVIDTKNPDAKFDEISSVSLEGVDVAIDFTHPDTVLENIRKVTGLGVNMVVGTTGWYDKIDEVRKTVDDSDVGVIWSGNFSIGVNILFRMIEDSARIMNKFSDYDPYVHEFHHNEKVDSPSGTAVMIGNILLDKIDRKERLVTSELKRKIEKDELHVSSTRAGSIPGTHIVGFDSFSDTIELKHTARGRAGFATGAVLAAEFINGKKGLFDINGMMDEIIGGE